MKKVNRYYCEFCPKANCSAMSIRKHEASCTLNPNRKCRMCALMEGGETSAQPLPVLIALLPDSAAFHTRDVSNFTAAYDVEKAFREAVDAAIPALRVAAANCPACIMAALRQSKIPVPMVEGFNFKTESAAVLDQYNANRMEEMHQYAHAY